MKKPTNLNKFRKTKIRLEKMERGDANSIKFGLTKIDKQANIIKNTLQEYRLDQLKREP
jgi:hypothetical protein